MLSAWRFVAAMSRPRPSSAACSSSHQSPANEGDAGGEVVAIGKPEEKRPALGLDPRVAANPASYTGQYLKQVLKRRPSSKAKRAAETQGAE
jgi:hypothetical protein